MAAEGEPLPAAAPKAEASTKRSRYEPTLGAALPNKR
jgi:hypothetical protein